MNKERIELTLLRDIGVNALRVSFHLKKESVKAIPDEIHEHIKELIGSAWESVETARRYLESPMPDQTFQNRDKNSQRTGGMGIEIQSGDVI